MLSFDKKENPMKIRLTALFLCFVMLLSGCTGNGINNNVTPGNQSDPDHSGSETQGEVSDLGDDSKTFGDAIEDTGAYDGYFEGES